MAGRKPKLPNTQTGNLTKEQRAVQAENESKLGEFTSLDFSKVPRELTKDEKKEWRRLAKDLAGLPLSELDRNLLITYCSYWSMYLEAKRNRDTNGVLVEEERNGYSIQKRNPAIDIMATASREIKAISSDLGLTVNGRLQIINQQNLGEDEDDPFANL